MVEQRILTATGYRAGSQSSETSAGIDGELGVVVQGVV